MVATETATDGPPLIDSAAPANDRATEFVARSTSPVFEGQGSLAPEVSVGGADPDDRARLDEALAWFREHGLELPVLETSVSDDDGGADRNPPANPTITDSPLAVPETSFVALEETAVVGRLPEPVCAQATTATELAAFFDLGDPMIGADYQRAFALPDGRVLWLFQDAFLSTTHGPELVHNVGLLQSGQCFQLLRSGSANSPAPYLLPELTDRLDRWFWPLGGGIGLDGNLNVFVAEMRERGSVYLSQTEPVATWLVSIDVETLSVVHTQPAPNPSAEMYGWSVVSQGEFTYLYAHCYRQFGWDLFPFADPPFRGHDWTCGPDVTVARIPHSDFSATPEYWNGATWASDPAGAVPVIPSEGRSVNPAQVGLLDGQFVAVTKVGDWWGDTIYLDVAPTAEGPWRTYATETVTPECETCNSYFASILPYGADENSFVVGLSVNTWGGDDLDHYSPTFLRVQAPNTSIETAAAGSTPV